MNSFLTKFTILLVLVLGLTAGKLRLRKLDSWNSHTGNILASHSGLTVSTDFSFSNSSSGSCSISNINKPKCGCKKPKKPKINCWLQGEKGKSGCPGSRGTTGGPGATGTVGPTGATGIPGDLGFTGPAGDTGATGIPGDTGPDGDAGPPGLPAASSPDAPNGPTGATGIPGTSGSTGAPGLDCFCVLPQLYTINSNRTICWENCSCKPIKVDECLDLLFLAPYNGHILCWANGGVKIPATCNNGLDLVFFYFGADKKYHSFTEIVEQNGKLIPAFSYARSDEKGLISPIGFSQATKIVAGPQRISLFANGKSATFFDLGIQCAYWPNTLYFLA